MKTVWTAAQDRMTLTVATPVMKARAAPLSPEAFRSVSATPRRLAELAVMRTRSAAALESSSIVANSAVAAPSIRRTLNQTEAVNAAAETLHPISVATCHGMRRLAMPKARTPTANANSTRLPAEKCEPLTPPWSSLPAVLATGKTLRPIEIGSGNVGRAFCHGRGLPCSRLLRRRVRRVTGAARNGPRDALDLSRPAGSSCPPCSRRRSCQVPPPARRRCGSGGPPRSEEHTSELQSRGHLVCRLLLEK